MGKHVTIKPTFTRVILPDGKAYDAGQTATLSNADFARMNADLLALVTVGSDAAEPGGGGGSTTQFVQINDSGLMDMLGVVAWRRDGVESPWVPMGGPFGGDPLNFTAVEGSTTSLTWAGPTGLFSVAPYAYCDAGQAQQPFGLTISGLSFGAVQATFTPTIDGDYSAQVSPQGPMPFNLYPGAVISASFLDFPSEATFVEAGILLLPLLLDAS